MARRLVRRGDSVEWFGASFPGAPSDETLEGIQIVREGHQWNVHWFAFLRYRVNIAERFDVVIDEVNTIPFFTPLWAKIPVVMLIHQLAREVWWYESPFPINVLGFLAEPLYLRLYRHQPVVTVSESTRTDLMAIGHVGPITIVPEGIEPIPESQEAKRAQPAFLFVGRLAPSKRLEHAILALALFRRATGAGTLAVVGSGSDRYRESLIRLARRLGVQEHVDFRGRVAADEKIHLMKVAHCLLVTSVREGWGLVVSEANACGTPAIVYDVPGLRDSVSNGVTGLVVRARPAELSKAMVRLTSEPSLYAHLAAGGRRSSEQLSFDESTSAVRRALEAARASTRHEQ